MEKEEFLIKLAGGEEEEAAASSPRLHYFNKVRLLRALVPAAGDERCVRPIRCCDYWRTSVCPSW